MGTVRLRRAVRRSSPTAILVLCVGLVAGRSQAQAPERPAPVAPPAVDVPDDVAEESEDEGEDWTLSAALYGYFLPAEADYGQPWLAFDWRGLHLEARYNYEDRQTGSLWAGYNISIGDEVSFAFTPMLGGVFGRSNGLAPGFLATLSFWRIELYSESEYMIDFATLADSFFYTWSEATLAPLDFVWFGFAAQRTRAYQSERELQRGFLIGLGYEGFEVAFHVFDPAVDPTVVLSVTGEF